MSGNTVVVQIVASVRMMNTRLSPQSVINARVYVQASSAFRIVPVHGQVANVVGRAVPVVCGHISEVGDLTCARTVFPLDAEDK